MGAVRPGGLFLTTVCYTEQTFLLSTSDFATDVNQPFSTLFCLTGRLLSLEILLFTLNEDPKASEFNLVLINQGLMMHLRCPAKFNLSSFQSTDIYRGGSISSSDLQGLF